MLGKILVIFQSKLALAAVGAAVVGGSGAAVAVAATQQPAIFGLPAQVAQSQHTAEPEHTVGPNAQSTANANMQSHEIDGTLKSYNASANTIVVVDQQGKSWTINVDSKTVVSGLGVKTMADLTGKRVEVYLSTTSGSTLLAVRVKLDDHSGTDANTHPDDKSTPEAKHTPEATETSTSQQEVKGTVASVNVAGNSFTLTVTGGTTVTVTVNAQTVYDSGVRSLNDVKVGMHIKIRALPGSGSRMATKVEVESSAG